MIDEAGGHTEPGFPVETEPLLFSVSFLANEVGKASFVGAAADKPSFLQGLFSPVIPDDAAFRNSTFSVVSIHNELSPLDTNNDGAIIAQDALLVINYLNSVGPKTFFGSISDDALPSHFLDVDDDHSITGLDALLVINWLNSSLRQRQVPVQNDNKPKHDSGTHEFHRFFWRPLDVFSFPDHAESESAHRAPSTGFSVEANWNLMVNRESASVFHVDKSPVLVRPESSLQTEGVRVQLSLMHSQLVDTIEESSHVIRSKPETSQR